MYIEAFNPVQDLQEDYLSNFSEPLTLSPLNPELYAFKVEIPGLAVQVWGIIIMPDPWTTLYIVLRTHRFYSEPYKEDRNIDPNIYEFLLLGPPKGYP